MWYKAAIVVALRSMNVQPSPNLLAFVAAPLSLYLNAKEQQSCVSKM